MARAANVNIMSKGNKIFDHHALPHKGQSQRGAQTLKALLHYVLFHSRFFNSPRAFLIFLAFSHVLLAFSLAFLIPTCWYPKREEKRGKNARKTREKYKKCEITFLYYTMHWVETGVSYVFPRVLECFR